MSANATDYQGVFVRRVHTLLALGYAVIRPNKYSHAEEEDITGDLVQAIEDVWNKAYAPLWMDFFSMREDPRVNDGIRKGKRRRKLDIRFDSSETRPRSRFCIEAKRLGPKHGVSIYLGKEGLQCFLDGHYARGESAVGMLGYIQNNTPVEWAGKIEKAMVRDRAKLKPLRSSPWRKEQVVTALSHTYRSGHDRPSIGQAVEVYHTLLIFN